MNEQGYLDVCFIIAHSGDKHGGLERDGDGDVKTSDLLLHLLLETTILRKWGDSRIRTICG